MQFFTVSFFGHRQIDNFFEIELLLEKLIRELMLSKEYVEFLVGRDGDFDQLVSSTVLRCKRTVHDDNSSLIWIMPYLTAEYRNNEEAYNKYYDEVEICSDSAAGHFKSAFQIRNRAMVDRSDLVIFCVEHASGGAYQTMKYAKKIGKYSINLAFSLDLFRYTNQVIAILFAQTTALSRTFPKIAFTAVAWLVCGISYLLHILTSHRLFFPDNSRIKKERLSSPGVGANKRSM